MSGLQKLHVCDGLNLDFTVQTFQNSNFFFNYILPVAVNFQWFICLFNTCHFIYIFQININIEEVILVFFLLLSLVTSLVVVPLSKFRMSKPYGVLLIIVYIVFLIVAILGETGVITGNIDQWHACQFFDTMLPWQQFIVYTYTFLYL